MKHECVYWKGSYSTGEWSTEGCNVDSGSNKTHTVCVCNHLTDFSVLMRVTDVGPIECFVLKRYFPS